VQKSYPKLNIGRKVSMKTHMPKDSLLQKKSVLKLVLTPVSNADVLHSF